jgi:hypothetical protein
MAEMSRPKLEEEMGSLVSPFQYAVHEPAWAVSMNANVRYLAPDSRARAAGLPSLVSYVSNYGAKT